MRFLGNCLIELAGPNVAMVETYVASRRLHAPWRQDHRRAPDDMSCRQARGRYLDRFERRKGEWHIVRRMLVIGARFTSVAKSGQLQVRAHGSPGILAVLPFSSLSGDLG